MKKNNASTNAIKHVLYEEDEAIFLDMEKNYTSENERNFFSNVRYKQEYEPTLVNDLLISEHDNKDEIYLVRCEYEEYIVGHGLVENRDEEEHVMCLADALTVNLHKLGFFDRNITLWQWLRECDYDCVRYDMNYDFLSYGE